MKTGFSRFLLLVIFVGSLTSTQAQTLKPQRLRSEFVKLVEVKRPVSVNVIPDFNLLIIGDGAAGLGAPLYYAYTLDSIKFIKSFLTLGVSEGQVAGASDIQYFEGDRYAHIFDFNLQRFCELSLDSIAKPKAKVSILKYFGRDASILFKRPKNFSEFTFTYPILLPREKKIIDIDNNLSVGLRFSNYFPELAKPVTHMLKLYATDGKFLSSVGKLPDTLNGTSNPDLPPLFGGWLNANEKGDRVIFQSHQANLISLYKTDGELVAMFKGNPETANATLSTAEMFPTSGESYSRMTKMYGKSIFAIHSSPKKFEQEEKGFVNLYRFNQLLVPKELLFIKGGQISFDVNPANGKIYALDREGLYINWK
ncbi:hypothetical protein GWC95_13420 [Sediminibacterium roseum]|uniref:TolB-like 6-blade propeller-like n=1 Tax=Sediminibacterium roseum TaxID=1978412 RepID=A0ABW9ZUU2_9BACT|nr:hypothetical protein [Sediminibacterium roseum]NCI50927.1 hypothetical protein [Sediminibacterium roseum]